MHSVGTIHIPIHKLTYTHALHTYINVHTYTHTHTNIHILHKY